MATFDEDEDALLFVEAEEMVAEAVQSVEGNDALADKYEALRVMYLEGTFVKEMDHVTGLAKATVYGYALLACPASIS
jgi:hypothetical protein